MTYVGNIPLEGTTRWDNIVRDLRSGGKFKFHVSHGDLTASATSQTLTFDTLPANSYVAAAWIELLEVFDDGSATAVTATVGTGSNPALYTDSLDVFTGAATGMRRDSPGEHTRGRVVNRIRQVDEKRSAEMRGHLEPSACYIDWRTTRLAEREPHWRIERDRACREERRGLPHGPATDPPSDYGLQ